MEIQAYSIAVDREKRSLGFWSEDYFLSNVYEGAPFIIDGIEFDSVERYYQSQRFRTSSPEIAAKILERSEKGFTLSSVECASLAMENKLQSEPNWSEQKDSVMETAIRAKVEQNPKIQRVLVLSKGWMLYEEIPGEWSEENEIPHWGLQSWVGENMNGQILMQIRHELIFEKFYTEKGILPSDKKTLKTIATSLGLEKGADWLQTYNAILVRRAKQYGFDVDGLEPWQVLDVLEQRFQQEALQLPHLAVGVEAIDSYDQIWKKISENYKVWFESLSPEEQESERLKTQTTRFLEINKFTVSWDELMTELEELGL
jgi:ribA/ribD-fused uncharacterized protein